MSDDCRAEFVFSYCSACFTAVFREIGYFGETVFAIVFGQFPIELDLDRARRSNRELGDTGKLYFGRSSVIERRGFWGDNGLSFFDCRIRSRDYSVDEAVTHIGKITFYSTTATKVRIFEFQLTRFCDNKKNPLSQADFYLNLYRVETDFQVLIYKWITSP
ncbi:hypothetical protein [Flavobacterium sp.]|uniref:hypothetical protein n=1 Tax=Flavobacterium sp. TaxID=239 RepID=UPI001228F0F4|nr:hypothetical protein [Flavobacterium sp.]RZJ72230.1 MAG: hypothetical protein EOO49_07200 [Flavobacterium sp.]